MREYVALCLAFLLPRLFPARGRAQESIYRAIFAAASTAMCLLAPFEPAWSAPTQAHRVVYGMQIGFYLQELLVLWTLPDEQKRSDHRVILAHHFLALGLITFSMAQAMERFGVAIILTHEPSDFFLELAKAANYCDSKWQTPLFFALIATWVAGRFGGLLYIMSYHQERPHWEFIVPLLVLISMNVYWFCLIIKAAIHRKDPRESSTPPPPPPSTFNPKSLFFFRFQ